MPIFIMAERRSTSGRRQNDEKKNKPRVDYEPRSAHGRAFKKQKVDYEPRPRG